MESLFFYINASGKNRHQINDAVVLSIYNLLGQTNGLKTVSFESVYGVLLTK